MPLAKMCEFFSLCSERKPLTKSTNKSFILLSTLFSIVFLATRLLGLRSDAINPDAVNWHYRSQQFVVGLKQLNFEKTYQHYHPGVTLMWVTGIPIELYKQATGIQHYTHLNFSAFHSVAKVSLVLVQLFLSLLILKLLTSIIGKTKSLLFVSVLSLEPFFLGNSRLYHMDILFSLLLFLALVLLFKSLQHPNLRNYLFLSLVLALIFLTRSLGIGMFLYALGVFSLIFLVKKDIKYLYAVPLVAFFVLVFTLALFPALWVKPFYYLGEIFRESSRVGVRKGHSQIFFSQITTNPGFGFYPLVLLLKLSPITLLATVYWFVYHSKQLVTKAFQGIKGRDSAFWFSHLLVPFYLTFFLVMNFPSKKIDRYMLVLFPFFAYCATLALHKIISLVVPRSRRFYLLSIFLLVVVFVLPAAKSLPYLFTYTSPLVGSSENANNIIGQKSFGVGIFELKSHIEDLYGEESRLGFIDTKPIKSIYSNSLVFDIRVSGTNDYDYLVLGINEVLPEKVRNSSIQFELSSVVEINGLDYWRIYAKKDN
jgi:hypothetical protein